MHVIYSLEHGGTERFLCRLAPRLAAEGLRQSVCTLRDAGERAAVLPPHIQVIPLQLRRRAPWGLIKLARVIRQNQPDIVHARNPNTWTDALLACRLARHPRLVLGFHGLQSAARFAPRMVPRLRLLGARRHTFACVSHAGRQLLADDLCIPLANIHVLPNGVDTDVFSVPTATQRRVARSRWQIADTDLAIGCVANLFTPIKGHAVLLDAFARVAISYPNSRLLLAGFGPLRDALSDQAKRLNLSASVHFLGHVESAYDVLAALDAYVCPSLSEGMSNALLEAMACGVPCAATDIADHRRMFAQCGAEKLLAPPGDAPALAAAIATLLAPDAPRRALGERMRVFIHAQHTMDRAVACYAGYYRALASGANHSAAAPAALQPAECCP